MVLLDKTSWYIGAKNMSSVILYLLKTDCLNFGLKQTVIAGGSMSSTNSSCFAVLVIFDEYWMTMGNK